MINYKILDESVTYYAGKGFQRIEAPWTVSEYVDCLTKPKDKISFQLKHNDKCLVASGEQSFLYLYLKEFLTLGQFQTITPCYRMEQFDDLHTKYFMKNELIKTDEVNEYRLLEVSHNALTFFKRYLPDAKRIETLDGFDIIYGKNEDELGSYGIRSCNYLKWIYGTAVAEPRLSNIMRKYGISH